MKRTTFSILFYIKRSKLLKNGNAPVYLKISINSASVEISLKREVNPLQWDTQRNRAKGHSKASKDLNEYLESVRGQLYSHQRELQENGKPVTVQTLRNAFLGIGEKQWTLTALFEAHNSNMEKLVGKDYSALTLQRFEAALKHIREYSKHQYGREALFLKEIDHKYLTGFEFYLKTTAGCQHNSAMKHLKALKKVIRIALTNDYLRKDPFASYRITQKAVDRERLTEVEIRKIQEKELSIERLRIVRDLFIFQCYTGLAYKDLSHLSPEHLQIGIDRQRWIYIKRGKTGIACHIPLLPVAEQIIERYRTLPECLRKGKLLPVPSNQKLNAYLKEVADLCGIEKNLHTHLARHTYATTVTLANGVSMETVSKLLGHTKLQTTQLYAKVLDTKISQEMEVLREKHLA